MLLGLVMKSCTVEEKFNQRSNGPVYAHLISGPIIITKPV